MHKNCNVHIFREIMDIMAKGSGSIKEGRAEDGKLCSHLEWPYKAYLGMILWTYPMIDDRVRIHGKHRFLAVMVMVISSILWIALLASWL